MDVIYLVAVVIALLAWLLIRRPPHPIDQLPGLPTLPFFGNVFMCLQPTNKLFASLQDIATMYPDIFRNWLTKYFPVMTVLKPSYLETILTSNTHIRKSQDYDFEAAWLGYGLLTSAGSKWHSRRKLLTPAFHFSILEQFVPVFSDKTRILIEKLRQHVDKPDGVDVVPLVTRCALDIICETAMGYSLNAQDDLNHPYVAAVKEINCLIVHRIPRPWLHPDWIFRYTTTGRKQAKCVQFLHAFTSQVIRNRREAMQMLKSDDNKEHEGGKVKTAFLDLLLRASEEDPTLTDEEIRSEVDTFMFAGHDTSAMAISWTIYFLSVYTGIQAKCVEELDEIFSGSDRDPTLADLRNMKYLERVIKETLRLRAPVPLIARLLESNLKLDGFVEEFPPKTTVHIGIHFLHRNPEVFPNPEKFDPDRFLPENCVGRHPYAYIPFSAGPRNCIGQKFAMLEMKNLLSTVLRHFRLESCDPEKYAEIDPKITLRPMYGNVVRIYNKR